MLTLIDQIDFIEALNARMVFSAHNDKARDFAASPRSPHHRRQRRPLTVGGGPVLCRDALLRGPRDFIAALRQGRLKGRLSTPFVHLISRYAYLRRALGWKPPDLPLSRARERGRRREAHAEHRLVLHRPRPRLPRVARRRPRRDRRRPPQREHQRRLLQPRPRRRRQHGPLPANRSAATDCPSSPSPPATFGAVAAKNRSARATPCPNGVATTTAKPCACSNPTSST